MNVRITAAGLGVHHLDWTNFGEEPDQLKPVQAQSSPSPPVPATLVAIATAIAFTDLTALFFVDASAAQPLAV